MKKIIALLLVIVLSMTVAVGGTLAYLQDSARNDNTMTLGKVDIEQWEYERELNEDGSYKTDTYDGVTSYVLKGFTQDKALLPSSVNVSSTNYDSTVVRMTQVGSYGGMDTFLPATNAQDKFVVVKNTGKTDAYVRTLVAIEMGTADEGLTNYSYHFTWNCNEIGKITVDGNSYFLIEFVYAGWEAGGRHLKGVLTANDTAYPSLSQVYIKHTATNEDMTKLDGNSNGKLDIIVLSQAVQAAGFDDATTALDTAFGDVTAENAAKWFAAQTTDGE